MAKLSIKAGTTSKRVKVFIQNSSVTTGAGLTGLVYNTSGLTAYYIREGDSASTAITLVTATLGTWTSGGFIVADGTNMPGVYELDLPNAAIASGAASVVVYLQGASNMAETVLEIELTAVDNQNTGFGLVDASANVVQWNGTNVSTPATAGIPDVNVKNYNNQTALTDANNLPEVDVQDWNGSATGALPTHFSSLAIDSNGNVAVQSNIKKNTGSHVLMFTMTDSVSHQLKTGLTVTGTVLIDGANPVALTNSPSEIGLGWYKVTLAAADTNGNFLGYNFAATGADTRTMEFVSTP